MRTSRGRRQARDCPFEPNIVIDSKDLWSKKNTAQIRMIINQELYGSNWHLREADQLGEALDSFKLDLHDSTEEEKNIIGKERNKRAILLDEEESLKRKQKGAKISYWEKVYLYTLMKKDKMSKRVLASKIQSESWNSLQNNKWIRQLNPSKILRQIWLKQKHNSISKNSRCNQRLFMNHENSLNSKGHSWASKE